MLGPTASEARAKRLAAIGARDPDRALFGAQHHKHHPLPPLAEEEVVAVEDAIGVQLPAAYRRYCTEVSSGGIGPGYGLPWLVAWLSNADERGALSHAAAARRMFPDAEARAWAEHEFEPLSDSDIAARLHGLPPAIVERETKAAEWVRTFEGRRNRYIDRCHETHRTAPKDRARLRFPFSARHTAAPDIDAIDWQALDDGAHTRTLERLIDEFGFRDAENGTIRLSDYGCGVMALLVVTGAERGAVWMYDRENLVIEPFFPGWADWHRFPPPALPCDFEVWVDHWMAGAELQLGRGVRAAGRLLWD
jgi:hypothetical protein